MREIKFRGRNDDGKWFIGDLLHESWSATTRIVDSGDGWNRGFDEEVDFETVGQYTGLKDKNGVEIYEGDIVDATNEWWDACGPAGNPSPIILVEWYNYHCGFHPFANYDCDCGVYIDSRNVEVIGNIHENPEFLEVK